MTDQELQPSRFIQPLDWITVVKPAPRRRALGGPGSGYFGHAGRPGEVGGSAPWSAMSGEQRVNAATAAGYQWLPKPESKSGNYAWYKDGVQVSKFAPKGDAAKAAETLHHGKGIEKTGAKLTAPKVISEVAAKLDEISKKETVAISSPKAPSSIKPLTSVELKARSDATLALMQNDKARKHNAVLELQDDPKERVALINAIGGGPELARAQKEYEEIPIADLRVLKAIRVADKPVSGQAHCTWEREVVMGSTSVSGDFRHELGHAVHMSMSQELQNYAKDFYAEAKKKAAKNPAGVEKKLDHEFYETKYGVIGKRALDNWHENFAEHYRGYHKAVYQVRHGEDPKALDRYADRFPTWNALWNSHYSAVQQ